MKRITIIGNTGSGKSTLAEKLGKILNIPVYHLDSIYWKPGWLKEDTDALTEQVRRITETEEWIIEGNYRGTMADRFERSDLILFLNIPLAQCIKNIKIRDKSGLFTGMPNGKPNYDPQNPNQVLQDLIGLAETYDRRYAEVNKLLGKHKTKVVELKSRQEISRFIKPLTGL